MSSSRNIRLTLAYDGTNYCGWQVQTNGPTIQAALERAVAQVTGESAPVFAAGRTDSGVHALGQVANFHTHCPLPAANFRPALQTRLPRDIVVRDAQEAPAEFHATYSARSKCYRYVIDNSPVPLPFSSRYAWQLRRRLDGDAMHAAAQRLVGTHDFRSFETDWPNKATSVRTVFDVRVAQVTRPAFVGDEGPAEGDFLAVEISADGFLYNMVRTIVGTLVNVGRGKWTASDVERILRAQDRSVAGATAPAQGLFLVSVGYP